MHHNNILDGVTAFDLCLGITHQLTYVLQNIQIGTSKLDVMYVHSLVNCNLDHVTFLNFHFWMSLSLGNN